MSDNQPIVDEVNIGLAAKLLGHKKPAPMATCPKDHEPLVSTFEFHGAEFICMVCGQLYGFLSPHPMEATPELRARHVELREQYRRERAERQAVGTS